MIYHNIVSGKFIDRPNRFIANIEVDGEIKVCHVKNTGRCKELLVPGVDVLLEYFQETKRKTSYDLISVYKGKRLINMDSQAPNKIVKEFLEIGSLIPNIKYIKPECKHLSSRFDFYVEADERKIFIEVKGVTLEDNGIVKFPDAPTSRGVRHINELIECVDEGFEAYVIFVVQMRDVKYFSPNNDTHHEFGKTLIKAKEKGVKILAYECEVGGEFITLSREVPVIL